MLNKKNIKKTIIELIIAILVIILGYFFPNITEEIIGANYTQTQNVNSYSLSTIPE